MTYDPAGFAAAVRELAVRTHRATNAPALAPDEFHELWRQSAALEFQARELSAGALTRWLANVQKTILACQVTDRKPAPTA